MRIIAITNMDREATAEANKIIFCQYTQHLSTLKNSTILSRDRYDKIVNHLRGDTTDARLRHTIKEKRYKLISRNATDHKDLSNAVLAIPPKSDELSVSK